MIRTRKTYRPRLEGLEQRLVLSNYFVATTGSDTAAGSSTAPWRTLQHAADRSAPGDLITVRAGTYAGFYQSTSGTATFPILFQADSGVVINSKNPYTNDGINLEGASFVTIDGFKVTGVPRAGIRSVLNQGVVLRNNVLDANGTWGILTGWSQSILIDHNVASRSVQQHGIYVSNSADFPVIRNNTVWGNHDSGIQINADVNSTWPGQVNDGIITGALVEGNVVYNNGTGGGAALNNDGVQDSTFRNNLLYNNHATGLVLYQFDGAEGSKNNLVENNTIVNASDSRWGVLVEDGSTGNTLLNNIVYNNGARGSLSFDASSLPGLVSDYNVLDNRLSANDTSSILSLAQWRATTGQDAHSLNSTPASLFVNVAASNYHLAAGSPAVDAGTSQSAPTVDLEGLPRPVGLGWDIGAYERQLIESNQPPKAVADVLNAGIGVPTVLNVLANDSDPDGDPLTVTSVTQGAHGSIAINADNTVTYTSAADYQGTDSFTYTISDGKGGTATATVSVTVAPPPPVFYIDNLDPGYKEAGDANWATAYGNYGFHQGTRYHSGGNAANVASWTASGLSAGRYEVFVTWVSSQFYTSNAPYTIVDGATTLSTTTVSQKVDPVGATDQGRPWQSLGQYDLSSGTLVVKLGANANGTIDADAIRVVNLSGPTNHPPVANPDQATTSVGLPVTINVLANDTDPDNDPLTVTNATAGAHGTTVVNANGTVTYTPASGYQGADSFTYTISDGKGGTASASVAITVTAVDLTGPKVTASTPSGSLSGSADHVSLTFNEPILDGSFTLADVVSLTGPNGAIAATAVNKVSATQYDVTFATQSALGAYSLVIGPNITDVAGNAMDQNGNGTNGETPQDQYTATFTLAAAPPIIYVDNLDPGYKEAGDANWATAYGNYGFHQGTRYHSGGNAANVASWTVTGLSAGHYEVFVTWVSSQYYTASAPYSVLDGATLLSTTTVSQKVEPVGVNDQGRPWRSLGQYDLSSGTLVVKLSASSSGTIDADAIRIVKIS